MIVGAPFLRSPKGGAKTTVYLASSPDVAAATGGYYVRRKLHTPLEARSRRGCGRSPLGGERVARGEGRRMRFPGEQDLLDERSAVLVTLASLTDDEFESGTTLCAEWSPRDVLAHLMGIDGSLGEYVKAKGNIARANAEIVERARARPAAELMASAEHWATKPAAHHPRQPRCSCSATPPSTTRTSCAAPVDRGTCRHRAGPPSCARALVLGPAPAAALPGGARRRRSAHGSGRRRAGQLRGARPVARRSHRGRVRPRVRAVAIRPAQQRSGRAVASGQADARGASTGARRRRRGPAWRPARC